MAVQRVRRMTLSKFLLILKAEVLNYPLEIETHESAVRIGRIRWRGRASSRGLTLVSSEPLVTAFSFSDDTARPWEHGKGQLRLKKTQQAGWSGSVG